MNCLVSNVKCDIIAHSMGGLVSRYLIEKNGSRNIERLFMVGTPTLGAEDNYIDSFFLDTFGRPLSLLSEDCGIRDLITLTECGSTELSRNSNFQRKMLNAGYDYDAAAPRLNINKGNTKYYLYTGDKGDETDGWVTRHNKEPKLIEYLGLAGEKVFGPAPVWDSGLLSFLTDPYKHEELHTLCAKNHICDEIKKVITAQVVTRFDVPASTITLGDSFVITYSVSDISGTGLKQAELWCTTNTDGEGKPIWPDTPCVTSPPTLLSGFTYSGSFSEKPTSAGTYWYGLHVVDNTNNMGVEPNPPGPIKVLVTAPVQTSGSVTGKLHEDSVTGPALAGATVTCGGRTATTLSDGSYTLTNVLSGSQILSFSKTGYELFSKNITVTAGQNLDAGHNYLTKTPTQQSTLTVTKSGTGSGTVTSSPAGISCGSDCTENYNSGTTVTLTASVSSGSTFAGWSGGGCSGTGSCTVTMDAAKSVTATFNQQATALPDFTISASVGSSYTSGQTVQIPVTVSRSGGDITNGTYVLARLYWSTNSMWDSADVNNKLWESNGATPDYPVSYLNSNGSKTVTATINIPNLSAGTYYIIAVVDPESYQSESNESNNTVAYTVSVSAATVLPDFTVSTSVSSSYTSGQTNVQIPVTVTRSGGQIANGTYVTARLYWSTNSTWDSGDTQLWESNGSTPDYSVTYLNSNGSKTVTPQVTIPSVSSGTYYIIAVVDPINYQSESNESNNTVAYAITVSSSPNPTLSLSPSSGPQGTSFYYTGSNYPANGIVEWHVRKPDGMEYTPTDLTGKVNSSGNFSHTYVSTCSTVPGTYTIWAIDKSTGKSSNTVSETITSSSSCSTAISSISPSSATKGQTVTFTLTGNNFQSGFTAKLINKLGTEYPIASSSTQFIRSTSVKVTVYLGSGSTSTQKIKIINPDGQSAQISFTALAG